MGELTASELGEMLFYRRVEAGLTRAELAAKRGETPQTVKRRELGQSLEGAVVFWQVLADLGCEIRVRRRRERTGSETDPPELDPDQRRPVR